VSEPVTGEGIYFALKSGDIAAEAINRAFRCGDFSAERLSLYERDCRSVFRLRWRMNALIRWLIHRPALLAPLIRVANKKSPMLESLVRTICQPELAGSHSLK
jgi:flavin-dependent dehydrogenase